MSVCLFVCVCVRFFVKNVQHLNISAKCNQIFTKLSANAKIGLLRWLIMSMGMHCTHRAWKHACNLGQWTNHYISTKWGLIVMKLSRRYQGCTKNNWEQYVHACKRNAHKHACMFLYCAILAQPCPTPNLGARVYINLFLLYSALSLSLCTLSTLLSHVIH